MAARGPSAEDGCVRTVDRGYRDYVAVPLRPDRGSFWLRRMGFSGFSAKLVAIRQSPCR